MPSRMIHYLVAERVAEKVPIRDMNRFKIGSLCPDMSTREDKSKHITHYSDVAGNKKGMNWKRYTENYREKMEADDLYLGVLCHLITDGVWFHDTMEPCIRSKAKEKEERNRMYQEGYGDFHRLNYLLREEFDLRYELTEDRNIELSGLHPEFYDGVIGALYGDFFEEPPAKKEELVIYRYEPSLRCIEHAIEECVKAITAFRKGEPMEDPERFYVPVYDTL